MSKSGKGKSHGARSPDRRRRGKGKRRAGRSGSPLAFVGAVIGWVILRTLRQAMGIGLRTALFLALVTGAAAWYYHSELPPVTELIDARTSGSVTLLDRHGSVFAWRGKQFGGLVTSSTIAPVLRNSVIATEDRRFYRHFGISPRGIAGAVWINLSEGRGPFAGHGGSTITQQVAKLMCLGVPYDSDRWDNEEAYETECRRGTLWRKIKEVPFAIAMELKYTKDEILTVYLNRCYLGAGAYGFEAASQRYFGKSAADVNVAEAAMLAGLLTAPTRYAPTSNLQRAQARASTVLDLLVRQGHISTADAAAAKATPAELSAAAQARAGGYFADWVMGRGPSFLTRSTTEDVIIKTTLDQRIQTAAEEGLKQVLDAKLMDGSKAQAAVVVMSADGAVRAMVGGRRFKGIAGAFNRAIMARRQTGSAFKPFVYAAALEHGYRVDDPVLDAPLTIDSPRAPAWSPRNYTGEFVGETTLTEALAQSLNVPAVRISEAVGRERVRKVAETFGVAGDLAAGPALALGASESTLLEMTGAYAGILNGGTSVRPYGLVELRLLHDPTPLMGKVGGLGERAVSPAAARQLVYMMFEAVERGTGQRARLSGREVAGKTGTTQAARDAWFLGFTADYVAGVWMGYDDNTPLRGVTGGGLPAEIWHEIMLRVHEGLPIHDLPMIAPDESPRRARAPTPVNEPHVGVINELLRTIFGGRGR
ncbi:MAG: PBP1A family penicillin-binding protein [Rhodobacter sp.]|nr:PBP1A family penicillin-binding protein [Rhodobacter sp.]